MPWICDVVALHERLAAKIPPDHFRNPPSAGSQDEHTPLGDWQASAPAGATTVRDLLPVKKRLPTPFIFPGRIDCDEAGGYRGIALHESA